MPDSRLVPQMRSLAVVRRVLELLAQGVDGRDAIADELGLRERQVAYALNAAECLQWAVAAGRTAELTQRGASLLSSAASSGEEASLMLSAVDESPTVRLVAPGLAAEVGPTRAAISQAIRREFGLSRSTADHRAGCLIRWRRDLEARGVLQPRQLQLETLSVPSLKPVMAQTSRFDSSSKEYRDLQELLAKNPRGAVFLTGAGIGKFSGLPLWSELRERLLDSVLEQALLLGESEQDEAAAWVDQIRDYSDLWEAFDAIERKLPEAVYQRAVQASLHPGEHDGGNAFYDQMWGLNVRGLLTFNLDRTPADSHARVTRRVPDTATPAQPERYASFLRNAETDSSWILFPHGELASPSSWVFTPGARDRVLTNEAFRSFFSSLFMSRAVVIAGFSPEDISFESHILQQVAKFGSASSRIFILTHRGDPETLGRYARWGLRVVRYQAVGHDHSALLDLMRSFGRIRKAPPPPRAFRGELYSPENLPDDNDLSTEPEEQIRRRLNAAVASLVEEHRESETEQIEVVSGLLEQYPRSVHKAWLVTPGHPELGSFFGRDIDGLISTTGSFGQVYMARTPEGDPEAVKILRNELHTHPEYLVSFRRGIDSLRILGRHSLPGVVRLHEAFEVPPAIAMEYVPGPTLEEAVKAGMLPDLASRLAIARDVARIVGSAHVLDEVVLHRDIKPSNIILRDFQWGDQTADVVMLDFDLSWHRGVEDLSVAHNARMQGYAAPEQTRANAGKRTNTRSTAVDSFGIGMLVYFLVLGKHPNAGAELDPALRELVGRAASRIASGDWQSAPRQVADLVHASTRREQSSRPSMNELEMTLGSVVKTLTSDTIETVNPAFLLELAERVYPGQEHSISEFGRQLQTRSRAGCQLTLQIESADLVAIHLQRTRQSHDDRSGFSKYLERRLARAAKALRKARLRKVEENANQTRGLVRAFLDGPVLDLARVREVGRTLSDALSQLAQV